MNSITSAFVPNATGDAPKQLEYIPNLKLNDGNEIPLLGYGLGTANFKRKGGPAFDEKVVNNTITAIKTGYYHLDGAEAYGNETELGAAIKRAGIPREKLFVVTKTSVLPGETIELAFSRSLEKLGLDYVDLYLIHHPFWAASPEDQSVKWAEMEALKESGRARSIGVSNYLEKDLAPILATAKYPPAINQIEFHPYLQHGDLLEYHRKNGIAVSAFGSLTAITKAAPGPVDPVYEKLARKYGVGPGEIAIRWCLDQGVVTLTTSGSEERLHGYLKKLPAFKLTPKEVEEISEAGKQKHFRGFWNHKIATDDHR
ncbi:NADP-dependent oxidoreductase domain-containing protein [Lasiosphaeria hispida]|uniref:NADP-dependent oxidoreductase domain-containing protein n=1 Tax=Lasiosphaeria hispida TaxID=260671 RepID=A0AAJ0M9J4_9PEZI|nr:NADP-dependent oxidoreductase domain-containing protein [Lasiosphaeria hispida]